MNQVWLKLAEYVYIIFMSQLAVNRKENLNNSKFELECKTLQENKKSFCKILERLI